MVGKMASGAAVSRVTYKPPATLRIRLVGGVRHNSFVELNSADCGYQARLTFAARSQQDRYRLVRQITPGGARYLQFVHESLLDASGDPLPCVYSEQFKPFPSSKRRKREQTQYACAQDDPPQTAAITIQVSPQGIAKHVPVKGSTVGNPEHTPRPTGNRAPPA